MHFRKDDRDVFGSCSTLEPPTAAVRSRFRLPARPHTDYSSLSCAFEMLAADLRGPRHKPEWNMYICAADRVTVRTKAM